MDLEWWLLASAYDFDCGESQDVEWWERASHEEGGVPANVLHSHKSHGKKGYSYILISFLT